MLLSQFLLCLCNQKPRGNIFEKGEAWHNEAKLTSRRPRPRQSVWLFRNGTKEGRNERNHLCHVSRSKIFCIVEKSLISAIDEVIGPCTFSLAGQAGTLLTTQLS
jgi:hypothetical protein